MIFWSTEYRLQPNLAAAIDRRFMKAKKNDENLNFNGEYWLKTSSRSRNALKEVLREMAGVGDWPALAKN